MSGRCTRRFALRRESGAAVCKLRDGEAIGSLIDSGLISLALLVATALVAGYFAYVYNLKRQAYLLYWTAGWSMLALHYLGSGLGGVAAANAAQSAIGQGLFAGAGIFFFLGARQ